MKVKSESEVAQSCPTLSRLMDCSLPGSSIHGIFQARVLDWGAIAFSESNLWDTAKAILRKIRVKIIIIIKIIILFLYINSRDHKLMNKMFSSSSSVQFSHSVVSDSLRPHELHHARPPCPSPTPGIHPDSCPSSQ